MRTFVLLAAIVAAQAFASSADAQVFGTPPQSTGANTPNYGRPNLNTADTMTWSQRLYSWMPGFRENVAARPGAQTNFPDPDKNAKAYLQGFGFRRLR